MVQSIENLTRICGTILQRKPHPQLADYDVLSVGIALAEPIEGKADLLSQYVGSQLDVAVRRALLGNAQAGNGLRCRAKRTPDGAMCEPHPEADDFSVAPGPEPC
jgi:hypothetical protein